MPGAYAIAIELADTVAVMLSGRSPIALPAGRIFIVAPLKVRAD
jgi:hypothetical protein